MNAIDEAKWLLLFGAILVITGLVTGLAFNSETLLFAGIFGGALFGLIGFLQYITFKQFEATDEMRRRKNDE